jgi:hypothetical protein
MTPPPSGLANAAGSLRQEMASSVPTIARRRSTVPASCGFSQPSAR